LTGNPGEAPPFSFPSREDETCSKSIGRRSYSTHVRGTPRTLIG
jgi:hypothetical protein